MDKSTLSNYGWVVIVTLVLAVMLALATPFGSYVGRGASNVIKTFVNTSNDAIDEDNIDTQSDNWDKYLIDNEVNHALGIHEGGSYTTVDGETVNSAMGDGIVNFPSREPQVGDTYVYGDYEYKYGYEAKKTGVAPGSTHNWNASPTEGMSGWGVKRADTSKDFYGRVLESINGKPLVSMQALFTSTANDGLDLKLSDDFKIPSTVTNISYLLYSQQKMTSLPETFSIPNGIILMEKTFAGLKSMKTIPNFRIPNGVTTIDGLVQASTGLEFNEPIIIPESVTHAYLALSYATFNANIYVPKTTTDIRLLFSNTRFGPNVVVTIDAEATQYNGCFINIYDPVKITGSSSILHLLPDTYSASQGNYANKITII